MSIFEIMVLSREFQREIILFCICKYCILSVKKIVNFSYEVNLTICPIMPDYALHSLRDALLFHGHAHIGDPKIEVFSET